MKGVKHYTKDGKEWEGKSHKMDAYANMWASKTQKKGKC